MILVVVAGLCLLTVPLAGGRLQRIVSLRLRAIWIPPLAVGIQLLITTLAPGGSQPWHAAIHVATYAMIGVFVWANRRLPGVALVAIGALANAITIAINGGVMPAAATALRIAGLQPRTGFNNSAQLAHPHLLWLGDVIPVPGPLANVVSVGDLLVFGGLLVLLHRTCRRARSQSPAASTAAAASPAGRSPESRSGPIQTDPPALGSRASGAPAPARR